MSYANEIIILTQTNIVEKSVTLKNTVASGFAKIKIQSSTWFLRDRDFTIIGKILSWNGFAELEAKLEAGDNMYIKYMI